MRSFIAALRSLTLPFGSSTGERIELDGVNGEIRIYDASNNLLITINGEDGFTVYDATEYPRVQMGSPLAGAYSAVQMLSHHAWESDRSVFSLDGFGKRNRIVIAPGELNNTGSVEWTILSNSHDNTSTAMLQAVCLSLDALAGRPVVDLTGAAAPAEAQQLWTIVYKLFWATRLPTVHRQRYLAESARD